MGHSTFKGYQRTLVSGLDTNREVCDPQFHSPVTYPLVHDTCTRVDHVNIFLEAIDAEAIMTN